MILRVAFFKLLVASSQLLSYLIRVVYQRKNGELLHFSGMELSEKLKNIKFQVCPKPVLPSEEKNIKCVCWVRAENFRMWYP